MENTELIAYLLNYIFSAIGIIYAGYCFFKIYQIKIEEMSVEHGDKFNFSKDQKDLLIKTAEKIAEGSNIFLFQEYLILLIFIAVFFVLIVFLGEHKLGYFYTSIAFVLGTQTSLCAGFVGMKVATYTNSRTAYRAFKSMGESFKTAYFGGCVLGFFLVSSSIIVLCSITLIYKAIRFGEVITAEDWKIVFEGLAGYGLGGSSVALFCRVGGGIYTKAADVGADLVSKLELALEEDDPRNPACIADNVGDNVGDIAGMGSDLFGSMAETLCAALLVGSTSVDLTSTGCYTYPILIISFGIIVCLIVTYVGFIGSEDIENYDDLENTIKSQLIISTFVLIPIIMLINNYFLPTNFSIGEKGSIGYIEKVNKNVMLICPLSGLISGLLIGLSTEYFTSLSYKPVKDLAQGCKEGAAINTILGLALGYISNIIPTILIGISLYASFKVSGMFGIAICALGMISNLPICLAIDGYGPISDNAGGLASMCELDPVIREVTDQLDAAGNTTAAIGKGFAIGSAALCSLALFGAFITRTNIASINVLTPLVLSGVLFGAMIPYIFSALTMKAVGSAAEGIVEIIRKDFNENKHNADHIPDSNSCIQLATQMSLTQMIIPGIIVIFVPILFGLIFGATFISGYLLGVITSGIQLAISMSNSGGAWDNCKKLIKNKGLSSVGIERYHNMKKDLKYVLNTHEGILNRFEELSVKKDEFNKRKSNLSSLNENENREYLDTVEEYQKLKGYLLSREDIQRIMEELEFIEEKIRKMEDLVKKRGGIPDRDDAYKAYVTSNNYIEGREREKEERLLIREFHETEIIRARFQLDVLRAKSYKRRSFRFAEKASIVGDTIGDPLKDTSGPSLNILVKLSSIISVVFADFYIKTGYAAKYLIA